MTVRKSIPYLGIARRLDPRRHTKKEIAYQKKLIAQETQAYINQNDGYITNVIPEKGK
jgi:hypothetical protein